MWARGRSSGASWGRAGARYDARGPYPYIHEGRTGRAGACLLPVAPLRACCRRGGAWAHALALLGTPTPRLLGCMQGSGSLACSLVVTGVAGFSGKPGQGATPGERGTRWAAGVGRSVAQRSTARAAWKGHHRQAFCRHTCLLSAHAPGCVTGLPACGGWLGEGGGHRSVSSHHMWHHICGISAPPLPCSGPCPWASCSARASHRAACWTPPTPTPTPWQHRTVV